MITEAADVNATRAPMEEPRAPRSGVRFSEEAAEEIAIPRVEPTGPVGTMSDADTALSLTELGRVARGTETGHSP